MNPSITRNLRDDRSRFEAGSNELNLPLKRPMPTWKLPMPPRKNVQNTLDSASLRDLHGALLDIVSAMNPPP
ncbi:hypothetical protein [Agrobacterium fabrum]|uniref:hypothetical protein n=1 Tax=Agrobacterium fabrum TaxID=1176649 RepID=UPI003CC7AE7C